MKRWLRSKRSLGEDNQYGPDAYKRLELVRKQFKSHAAELKKRESGKRRQRIFGSIRRNRTNIVRFTTYAILALLVLAVIGVVIATVVLR